MVNCGSANGSFGDDSGNGRDYGIDQIAGLSKVGTEYIFVKGSGNNDWENVLIVPHTPNTTIDLIVNPLPEFFIEEEEIVCTSDPTFTIVLEPFQINPSETFNYEWMFEDGTILSNATTLNVSIPGDYSITLTNPLTQCFKTRVVSVKASELANITLDDVEIEDISENNTVTILNPESLGAGTYQFSLESKDGETFFPFQDSPVFNNVRADMYTLFVKDAICGTVEVEIYVVGYRKFWLNSNLNMYYLYLK